MGWLPDHTGQAHTRKETRGALPYTRICTILHYTGTATSTLIIAPDLCHFDMGLSTCSADTNKPKTVAIQSVLGSLDRRCQKRWQEPTLGLAESLLLRWQGWDRSRAEQSHTYQAVLQAVSKYGLQRPLLPLFLAQLIRFPRGWAGGQLKVGANLGT